ncbi:hypothetical protein Har1131_18615 [Haloarcula sp. CBA1131]|uniref:hypothetical protein n=1 Tax=Haloarcula sp. CBA1131 TaxID=1853686 RepID=UPI0012491906|nr:hypothetical protein [Haloarcula sp. CBA1131]KAA9400693.1 hypothetical protein Har1131_18615 [Haloarcula sp. CBA1131]
MIDHRSPRWVGLFVAGLGVIITGVHHFLLFWYPEYFIGTESARMAYLESWFSLVSTLGFGLRFIVIPLLAAMGGFYLGHLCKEPIQRVTGWFLVAGFVFGVGILSLDWIVAEPSFNMSLGVATQYCSLMIISLALPALVGAAVGHFSDDGTRSFSTQSI